MVRVNRPLKDNMKNWKLYLPYLVLTFFIPAFAQSAQSAPLTDAQITTLQQGEQDG